MRRACCLCNQSQLGPSSSDTYLLQTSSALPSLPNTPSHSLSQLASSSLTLLHGFLNFPPRTSFLLSFFSEHHHLSSLGWCLQILPTPTQLSHLLLAILPLKSLLNLLFPHYWFSLTVSLPLVNPLQPILHHTNISILNQIWWLHAHAQTLSMESQKVTILHLDLKLFKIWSTSVYPTLSSTISGTTLLPNHSSPLAFPQTGLPHTYPTVGLSSPFVCNPPKDLVSVWTIFNSVLYAQSLTQKSST